MCIWNIQCFKHTATDIVFVEKIEDGGGWPVSKTKRSRGRPIVGEDGCSRAGTSSKTSDVLDMDINIVFLVQGDTSRRYTIITIYLLSRRAHEH